MDHNRHIQYIIAANSPGPSMFKKKHTYWRYEVEGFNYNGAEDTVQNVEYYC